MKCSLFTPCPLFAAGRVGRPQVHTASHHPERTAVNLSIYILKKRRLIYQSANDQYITVTRRSILHSFLLPHKVIISLSQEREFLYPTVDSPLLSDKASQPCPFWSTWLHASCVFTHSLRQGHAVTFIRFTNSRSRQHPTESRLHPVKLGHLFQHDPAINTTSFYCQICQTQRDFQHDFDFSKVILKIIWNRLKPQAEKDHSWRTDLQPKNPLWETSPAPARLLPCLHRLREGLRQGLACSFVGNHEEVQHQRQPCPSHQRPICQDHQCSPL